MKVVIANKTYTAIGNLSFSPETDVVGTKIPINEFWVDIHTNDSIRNGANVFLKDDLDNIWAKYWVVYAERISDDVVRICGQSKIALLDRRTLGAVMYDQEPLLNVLNSIFRGMASGSYVLAEMYADTVISGFCPKQTARERLLWVCFVIGAYVKTYFSDKIEILPVAAPEDVEVITDDEVIDAVEAGIDLEGNVVETVVELPEEDENFVDIPLEKTFWKPVASYNDHVTKVSLTAYSFEEYTAQGTTGGTQGTTGSASEPRDEYVTVGSTKYIVTGQVVSLTNPDAPVTAPPNEVEIEGVYIVNENNVDDILSHLSKYYFNRMQLDIDVINNFEHCPGEKLIVFKDEDTLAVGYAESCNFSFGLQSVSRIKLVAVDEIESGHLIIIYKDGTLVLNKKKYLFPVGYEYSIKNPYIDVSMNGHRYIYRPNNEYTTGTIASGDNTVTQQCSVALDFNQKTSELHIISVDEVTVQTSDSVSVGVIA